MGKKKKGNLEFRYYELPAGERVLALTGQRWTRIYGRDVEGLHFHNLFEMGYCCEGTGNLVLEDQTYRFSKQMISAIPTDFPHTTLSDMDVLGTWEYLFIDVEGFLKEIYGEDLLFAKQLIEGVNKGAIFIEERENPKMVNLFHQIIDELQGKKKFYLESIKGALLALILEIVRLNEDENVHSKVHTKKNPQIQAAIDYVEQKYFTPLKVEALAEVCHMSETHFRRVFGESVHMSPIEYINLVRIQKACELMKRSNDSMRNIALKVGYPTPSTFDRNFKKVIGLSPNEWRRQPNNYACKLAGYNIETLKGW